MENTIQLKDINTLVVKRKVIMFDSTGNKAVYHNKEVRQVTGNIYIGETEGTDYYKYYSAYAIFGDKIGLYVGRLTNAERVDKIEELIPKSHLSSFDDYITDIEDRIANNRWINCVEREYIRNYRPDLVANIEVARAAYKAKQEEQREARAAERKAERIAKAERCNAEFMEVINKAIATLKNGGCVENKYMDLMENPDEAGYHEYKHYTTFTYLFDKYGIKLPIRTRGFVIDRLASVTYDAEKQGMQYSYMRTGNSKGSSKLYDYLYALVDKIKNESEECL